MNEFDKIKLANLNDYFSLLARIENPSINYIKRASRRFGFSFDEINQFLVELKLIKIDGQQVSLTNKTNNFIDDGRLKKKKLKETLVELLTKSFGTVTSPPDNKIPCGENSEYICHLPVPLGPNSIKL